MSEDGFPLFCSVCGRMVCVPWEFMESPQGAERAADVARAQGWTVQPQVPGVGVVATCPADHSDGVRLPTRLVFGLGEGSARDDLG